MNKLVRLVAAVCISLVIPTFVACRPVEPVFPIEPHVLLLSPAYDSIFSPGPVTVRAYVESVKLVDKVGQPNVAGEGHLIYYLDVTPPVVTGIHATTASGTFVASTELSYTWPQVGPGEHVLAIQLVNNDNTPMRAPSAIWVRITVR
jgi:hypothetical protein